MAHLMHDTSPSTIDRSQLATERRLAASNSLDTMTPRQIVDVMNEQDRLAQQAVEAIAADVADVAERVTTALIDGKRLLYIGAGTSGRLGVLDASECPPTFRSDPSQVVGIIAGGKEAMFVAQEGAEDQPAGGAKAMDQAKVSGGDVVVGIAAGGTTPYVHGALAEAKRRGATTVFLTCVAASPGDPPASDVDVFLRAVVGPEVLTGSTRLKAGTATKLVLNQITTAAMVGLGKCYENLMVDLKASNAKLIDRGQRILREVLGVDTTEASRLLEAAGGHVKVAIVMGRRGVDRDTAVKLLEASAGRLSDVLRQSP